jgi:hypothetical protein
MTIKYKNMIFGGDKVTLVIIYTYIFKLKKLWFYVNNIVFLINLDEYQEKSFTRDVDYKILLLQSVERVRETIKTLLKNISLKT